MRVFHFECWADVLSLTPDCKAVLLTPKPVTIHRGQNPVNTVVHYNYIYNFMQLNYKHSIYIVFDPIEIQ